MPLSASTQISHRTRNVLGQGIYSGFPLWRGLRLRLHLNLNQQQRQTDNRTVSMAISDLRARVLQSPRLLCLFIYSVHQFATKSKTIRTFLFALNWKMATTKVVIRQTHDSTQIEFSGNRISSTHWFAESVPRPEWDGQPSQPVSQPRTSTALIVFAILIDTPTTTSV